jgi:transcriptional regulator with XRE-family HTH domain
LERLRKLRGLRREDVAAQMREPVCASTIRNIEHDERYNVSLDQLRQIAEVLGASLNIQVEASDLVESPICESDALEAGRRVTDNEHFIRMIRSRYPDCPLTNSQIGRRMWSFAKPRGAELVKGRKQIRKSSTGDSHPTIGLPTTVARYSVRESDFALLEKFADRLGRAFTDSKGRVLIPLH